MIDLSLLTIYVTISLKLRTLESQVYIDWFLNKQKRVLHPMQDMLLNSTAFQMETTIDSDKSNQCIASDMREVF